MKDEKITRLDVVYGYSTYIEPIHFEGGSFKGYEETFVDKVISWSILICKTIAVVMFIRFIVNNIG